MRRAARTDANQSEIVQALRTAGASVTLLHQVGKGCPDALVGYQGKTVLLEIKTDKGRATPDQIEWWDQWKGGPVAMVRDVDGALRALGVIG